MESPQTIKGRIPDHVKDIHLNLDGMILRFSLEGNDAVGAALATVFVVKGKVLADAIRNVGILLPEEVNDALTTAALMDMSSVWYLYIEMADNSDLAQRKAELRMNAYTDNGGVDEHRFEMYALTVSITGKCHFCIKSHYGLLKNHRGMSIQQLRDVGRIAAVINTAAQVIVAEQPHQFSR